MPLILHNGMNRPLFKEAAKQIKPCDVLLDVGCGLRPQNMTKCREHICLEPHGEYADELERSGYKVVRSPAADLPECDTVIALDVIEHMEKEAGLAFISEALKKARKQVVIFTPLGFMPQEESGPVDSWGYQGQSWQRHRSGWLPEEFRGWSILISDNFHKEYGAFFAIWTHERI